VFSHQPVYPTLSLCWPCLVFGFIELSMCVLFFCLVILNFSLYNCEIFFGMVKIFLFLYRKKNFTNNILCKIKENIF